MATTKTKTSSGKAKAPAAPKAPKAPTKLETAQRIAELAPEMFSDGNTAEALAKRSTVADLDKMLREATALAEARAADANRADDADDHGEAQDVTTDVEGAPADAADLAKWANDDYPGGGPKINASSSRKDLIAWLYAQDRDGFYSDEDRDAEGAEPLTLRDLWEQVRIFRDDSAPVPPTTLPDAPPTWPADVVKGASVEVAEDADGSPSFRGTVEDEDRLSFLVSVRDAGGALWWVDPTECKVVLAPIGEGTPTLGVTEPTPPVPALDVTGDPLLAALGVTPDNVDSFADLIDPAHEARLDEAARAVNVRTASTKATTPAAPRAKAELPPVGTVLKHGLAGKAPQEARVVEGGVEFAGKVYPSLSQAAKAASTAAGHKHPATNGRGYWGLDTGGAPRQPRAAQASVTATTTLKLLTKAVEWLESECVPAEGQALADTEACHLVAALFDLLPDDVVFRVQALRVAPVQGATTGASSVTPPA